MAGCENSRYFTFLLQARINSYNFWPDSVSYRITYLFTTIIIIADGSSVFYFYILKPRKTPKGFRSWDFHWQIMPIDETLLRTINLIRAHQVVKNPFSPA